jgi:GDP-4-dehydro-6-deoxy-D-mannose reductase
MTRADHEAIEISSQRVVIFGSGFITSHFVSYVRNSLGWDTTVFYRNYLNPALNHTPTMRLPVSTNELTAWLDEWSPGYALIAVGSSYVPDINNNIESSIDVHINLTLFILNAIDRMRNRTVKKILVIGSASEYGLFPDHPVTEVHPSCPQDAYGMIKLTQYRIGRFYTDTYQLPIVHARQFNVSGIGQDVKFVIPSICLQVANIIRAVRKGLDTPIRLKVGNLGVRRDFLAIDDVVRAYYHLLFHGQVGQAYNVCSGRAHSVRELVEIAKAWSGLNIEVEVDSDLVRVSDRAKAVVWGSPEKLKGLGWAPTRTTEELLSSLISFYLENADTA